MGMSFTTALAANFQGEKLLQDLDFQKAQTANEQAMTSLHQAQVADMQRKADGEKALGQWIQAQTAGDTLSMNTAEGAAQTYQKGAAYAASTGNFDGAKQMSLLANNSLEQAKDLRVQVAAQQTAKNEAVAQAALTYQAVPSPENAIAMTRAATDSGINPVTIPPPGTMEWNAWAKNLQTRAMGSKDVLAQQEKMLEFDQTLQQRQDAQKENAELRRQQMAQTAQLQQGMQALQRESLEFRKQQAANSADGKSDAANEKIDKEAFKQETKIRNDADKTAKPYFQDRSVAESIKGLLSEGGSPAQDRQISQLLTSLKTGTGKATNLYYKDNKNFGDVAEKLSGFASQAFTGRYSDSQRQQIYDLVDGMERKVIDPALRNIESDAKSLAGKYNLKPDRIQLSQQFNRDIASKTEKGGAAVTGALEEAPAGPLQTNVQPKAAPAALPEYIKNPSTGEVRRLVNGQYVKQ